MTKADFEERPRNNKKEDFLCEFWVRQIKKKHQFLTDNPPATWQQLKHLMAIKDLRFAVISGITGRAWSGVDFILERDGKKDQLKN